MREVTLSGIKTGKLWEEVITTLIYSLLSSTLSVVNKRTLDGFPFPAFVLAVQLTSTAVVMYAWHLVFCVKFSSITKQIVLGFLPLMLAFFFLLASSLLLMANSPFYVFLICKSLTPFFMSLSEALYFGTPYPTLKSFLAIAGMTLGSVMYSSYEAVHLSYKCLFYAVLFICCSVFEGLIAKQTIQKFALNQTTRTFLMNVLSCPIAVTWAIVLERKAIVEIKLSSAVTLGMSCALGLGMGIATMHMRTMFTATYVSVVGVCNKFLSLIFANLVLTDLPSRQSTLSTAFILLCGSFYNENSYHSSTATCRKNVWKFMRFTLLLIVTIFAAVPVLNEIGYVTKLPSTSNSKDHSSATSGKLFLGSKTRDYKHPHSAANSWTSVKSSWNSSGIGQCDHFAVVTTIFAPSEAVVDSCKRLREYQGCLIVIGDAKGPENYILLPEMASCSYNFVSYHEQQNFGGSFARTLPHNHFGRKNLGYIAAIQNGATSVWDFDDDNIFINDKMGTFLQSKKDDVDVQVLRISQSLGDVLNPYPALGSTHFSWPRGFPLTEIKSVDKTPKWFNTSANGSLRNVGVVQALANHDPDVDAIYRLQRKLPLNFLSYSEAMILPVPLGIMSPFNAQATLWASPDAFWGLYLPVSVHGRVSDIWRSYIFQRLAKELCLQIAFSASPWVEQRRNAHSYIADLDAEHDLYFKTESLLHFLNTWIPSDASSLLSDMFLELYIALYEREYVNAADVQLSRMWIEELLYTGYSFPKATNPCALESSEASNKVVSEIVNMTTGSVSIMVRTYRGDEKRLKQLIRSVERFVPLGDTFSFHVILDADSQEDIDFGAHLLKRSQAQVHYQQLPPGCVAMPCSNFFHATAFSGETYGRAGYDRQQFDTFYLDEHTKSEVIGVVDSDACFHTFLTQSGIFADDGRIILRSIGLEKHYENVLSALNLTTTMLCSHLASSNSQIACPSFDSDELYFNVMWTDTMPMWFWRDTFETCRSFISSRWGMSFPEAFKEFSRKSFSQFDILANCALLLSPDRYKLVLPDDLEGVVSVGSNRCIPEHERIGCCRTYGVSCKQKEDHTEYEHILRYNNVKVAWLLNSTQAMHMADQYYDVVRGSVQWLLERQPEKFETMKDGCMPDSLL